MTNCSILLKLYFVFPYFGSQSEKLKYDLMSLFNKYFKDHKLQIILTNNSTIGSLFNFKDKLTKGMTVYKWGCPIAAGLITYIGSSSRNLRAAEHSGVSYRTGETLSGLPSPASGTPSCNSNNHIHPDNFNILGTSRNLTELRILDSLFIHKEKPSLNNMLSAFPLLIV